jgi:hypothetical protein
MKGAPCKIPSMLRYAALLALGVSLAAPAIHAQTSDSTAAAPTCPSTATLDQFVAALDAAVSGPADKDRTCMRALMLPEARLLPMRPAGLRNLTIDDWIAAVRKNGSAVFTEKQIKYQTETFGQIAHLWSTYETRSSDGKIEARGINSIQVVFDGQNWKVLEILWQAENPSAPIPAQYLP